MLTAIWKKRRSPNRREPKTAAMQKQHAWKRLFQRFGLTVHLTELDKLVDNIQAGKYQLIQKQSRRISVFSIIIENQNIAAVYDRERHTIVTFLPLKWIEDKPQIEEKTCL